MSPAQHRSLVNGGACSAHTNDPVISSKRLLVTLPEVAGLVWEALLRYVKASCALLFLATDIFKTNAVRRALKPKIFNTKRCTENRSRLFQNCSSYPQIQNAVRVGTLNSRSTPYNSIAVFCLGYFSLDFHPDQNPNLNKSTQNAR